MFSSDHKTHVYAVRLFVGVKDACASIDFLIDRSQGLSSCLSFVLVTLYLLGTCDRHSYPYLNV